jgi:hypothetical protein
MRSSTLAIVVGSVSLTILLSVAMARADSDGMRTIADGVNFGGAALTFAGLAYAYLRSNTELRSWFRALMHRLRVGPRTLTVSAAPIRLDVKMWANAYAEHSFKAPDKFDDPIERLHARTEMLLLFVNNLEQSVWRTDTKVHEVEESLDRARSEARKGDEETRNEAAAALQRFTADLKQAEALDLRWAIAGTFFSMLGALLSLYA